MARLSGTTGVELASPPTAGAAASMKATASNAPVAIAGTFADEAALAEGLSASTGVMIAFFDRELRIGWCNDRYAEWFGLPPSGLVGRRITEVYGQAAFAEASPRLQRALSGQHVRYERLLEKPGTTPKWISVSLHPHRDEEGQVLGMFACSIEVDELRRTRDALDRSLQEIAIYLENSPMAVVEWDREGRIRRWAGQAERMFGWNPSEVIGRTAGELGLVHPDWLPVDEGAMRELREGRELRNRVIVRNLTRGGRALYGEWFHSAFVDRDGATLGVLSLAQDITARVEAEEQLRQAAIHDAMTGCHNRAHLIHRIGQAIERARRHGETPALLYLDLDRFKPVNDQHGHAAGDVLLREVAQRLRECVRATDCVARVGGDEFVVLMEGRVEAEMAETLRERIAARLGEGFWIHGHLLSIGASIGLARFPGDGDSADALLRTADERMYGEKRTR
jgi:diguanylate cyclase (GGDEF)-like protein/PAS domain S-box-containing protein